MILLSIAQKMFFLDLLHESLGQALLHVMEENMRAEAGARSDTPFYLVLLTDGKSQDDAIAAANRLKNAGVEIIAVGEI